MLSILFAEAAMNEETTNAIMQWLPWVLLISGAIGCYAWWRDAHQKRVQQLNRGFIKMGSVEIADLLDAVARNDKPAIMAELERIAKKYQGEKGAKLFVWEVIKMGGDDLLKDEEYRELFGKWIEEQILGFILDAKTQADLMPTAAAMEKLNMKDSAALVYAFASGSAHGVGEALRRLVARFRNAGTVDDELVKWLTGGCLQTLVAQPEHTDALLKACGADDDLLGFVLDDEAQASLVPVAIRMGEFGMKDSSEFIASLGRNNKKNAMVALHALVKKFRDPEGIDEVLMTVAEKGIPRLMQDPVHAAALRTLVNGPPSLEEQRDALDAQIAAKGGVPTPTKGQTVTFVGAAPAPAEPTLVQLVQAAPAPAPAPPIFTLVGAAPAPAPAPTFVLGPTPAAAPGVDAATLMHAVSIVAAAQAAAPAAASRQGSSPTTPEALVLQNAAKAAAAALAAQQQQAVKDAAAQVVATAG